TVLITLFQSGMMANGIAGAGLPSGQSLIVFSRIPFVLSTMLAVTTGTIFLMWLGEQITERGVGNGISLIIFAGIVARFPVAVGSMINYLRIQETVTPFRAIVVVLMMIAVIAGIVIMTYAQRRITIRRGKQVVGRKVYGGQTSYLPIRVNTAGVIPVIFAAAIMIFPLQILGWLTGISTVDMEAGALKTIIETTEPFFAWLYAQMGIGGFLYNALYVLLIIFFCYFYTSITFNPKDLAENLQRYGSTIPGYSQGKRTQQYITYIIERVTLAGALMLSVICVVPNVVTAAWGIDPTITDFLGGTGLIIVVGVALDTVNQIENHLRMRNYDTFRKRGRVRGRRFA
ncbi:MAG TPA: preprotein translocase subunit SecY, partial [Firmicutes bacterium]|nr:preprotein translocase subunit SecY [Bacillota bacterium]